MVLSSEIHRVRPTEKPGLTFPNRIRSHFDAVSATNSRTALPTAGRLCDGDLKAKVQRHLESYAESLSGVVQIEVDGDTVIVSGTVDSDDDRQLVVQIISLIRDVLSIRDQMQVAYPSRGRQTGEAPEALWTAILGCWGQQP